MAASQHDVKAVINSRRMSAVQYATILICFLMNVLDGMDVLVIAFAAPAISAQWGIGPEALGIVLSAAVAGMTVGALVIAPLGDRFGRKPVILGCAALMGTSIIATSLAQSAIHLIVLRFVSGLGIGGMLASVSTLSSEYAPNRSKDFWVSLVMGGYPIGAVLSGMVAATLIPSHGWRALFLFAGATTLVSIPLIVFFLAESLEYLTGRRPRNALRRVNAILRKMKADTLEHLPAQRQATRAGSVSMLFAPRFQFRTLLLWLAFFMAFATLYFLLSWIPKLTTEAGMPERFGIYSGTVFNLGAFFGILVLGGFAVGIGLRKTIFVFLCSAAILMALFGFFSGSFLVLVMFGLIGFSMQAGFVGLYPVAARIYPTEIRSTGIGWAIGAGRLGAVLGPVVAGYLIGAGLGLTASFIVFAVPCVIAGFAAISIKSSGLS